MSQTIAGKAARVVKFALAIALCVPVLAQAQTKIDLDKQVKTAQSGPLKAAGGVVVTAGSADIVGLFSGTADGSHCLSGAGTLVTCSGGGGGTVGAGLQGARAIYPAAGTSIQGSGAPILDCSQFAGADDSLKIQACLVALDSINHASGIADARGLTGNTWSVNPFLASAAPIAGTLLLPPGVILIDKPLVDRNYWNVQGMPPGSNPDIMGTTVRASPSFPTLYSTGTVTFPVAGANAVITGTGTSWTASNAALGCAITSPATQPTAAATSFGIITAVDTGAQTITVGYLTHIAGGAPAGSTYQISCAVHTHGSGSTDPQGYQYYMASYDLTYDCNSISGCVSDRNWYGNQGALNRNVTLRGSTNIGFDLENQYQQSGPWDLMIVVPGAGCTAGYIPIVVRGNNQGFYGITNTTIVRGPCSPTNPNVAIDVASNNTILDRIDIEAATVGVGIDNDPICLGGCARPTVLANNVAISNVYNVLSGTSVVKIMKSAGNSPQGTKIENISKVNGGSTNLLDDSAVNGCTISTENRIALYTTDITGAIKYSTSNVAGCQGINVATANTASVSNEIALWTGTGGKTLTRATTSGVLKGTSGVLSAAAFGDIVGLWTTCTGFLFSDGTCSTPSGGGTVTNTGGNLTANATVLGAGGSDAKVVPGITTDGASTYIAGVNTTTLGKYKMFGSTSGDVTIQPNAVAGTGIVITAPAASGNMGVTFGTLTAGDCLASDSSGRIVDAGACGGASFANPSASVSTGAVNGVATTAMRSDAAPAINQNMTPTWTGKHIFSPNARASGASAFFQITTPADTNQTASTESLGISVVAGTRTWATGALTLQREILFAAPTFAFGGASALTTGINLDVADPICGTNGTCTALYSLRTGAQSTTTIDLGNNSDTTLARSAAGVVSVEGVNLTRTIASGTSALGTGAIGSGACATAVTTTATGTATTDVINWGFNGDPTAVTGYVPLSTGMLAIIAYPSSGNVNFKVCNNTSSSITPGAITLNWNVHR